jgi:hypothetical protein
MKIWLRRTLKTIGLLLIFAAGFFAGSALLIWDHITAPKVYSDTKIRNQIEPMFPIPEKAHHLYCSQNQSFLFNDKFISFVVDDEDAMEKFLQDLNHAGDDLKPMTQLPEEFTDHKTYPDTWPQKYQDKNWQLSQETDFLGGVTAFGWIFYVPQKHRVYIAKFADG